MQLGTKYHFWTRYTHQNKVSISLNAFHFQSFVVVMQGAASIRFWLIEHMTTWGVVQVIVAGELGAPGVH